MKYRQIRMNASVLAFLGIVGVALSILASNVCFTWDDPPCTTETTTTYNCRSCGRNGTYNITNQGTHWICDSVSSGWPDCQLDVNCLYYGGGLCPWCGRPNQFVKGGQKDQLVGGGTCP